MATLVGQTTASGGGDFFAAGDCAASKYVAVASGTAATMSILITGTSFTSLTLGIYSESGSTSPAALLAQTSAGAITNNSAGIKTANLTSTLAITSGVTYWLAVLSLGGTMNFNAVPGSLYEGHSGATTLTDPFGTIPFNDLSNGFPIQADSAAGGAAITAQALVVPNQSVMRPTGWW
jgi:hypothetical protein